MACSLAFAYLVLFATTYNYAVAAVATMSIFMIVGSIVSYIYLAGWGIGLSESIGLIVTVGFSVDYIVHMSHVYVESIYDTRKHRVDNCYSTIGGTIVHGATTSLGAGFVMTQCYITELRRFGILIMFTILAALFFSLVFYPAFSYQAGPQFTTGSIFEEVIEPMRRLSRTR